MSFEGQNVDSERNQWEKDRDEEYAIYIGRQKLLEEFTESLPSDPKELFRLRKELNSEQQKLDASGRTVSGERRAVREARDEWRFMQDKVHAINRKLNELDVDEPEK